MTQAEVQQRVEELVDVSSMDRVLAALEETCYLKAEHLRSAWQDRTTARGWDMAGKRLESVRMKLTV
jgi:hypothetical protein